MVTLTKHAVRLTLRTLTLALTVGTYKVRSAMAAHSPLHCIRARHLLAANCERSTISDAKLPRRRRIHFILTCLYGSACTIFGTTTRSGTGYEERSEQPKGPANMPICHQKAKMSSSGCLRYHPVMVGSSLQPRSVPQRLISGHIGWILI